MNSLMLQEEPIETLPSQLAGGPKLEEHLAKGGLE